MKAMIFAAGMGTRLKPFTDRHPKALFKVNGISLLERNIIYLKKWGITEIVINIHHFADQIREFLLENNNFGCQISLSDETDELLETGGGLKKAQTLLAGDDFILLNVDILTQLDLEKMILQHQTNQPMVTLAVSDRESSRKLRFDSDLRLCGWVHKQTGETIGCSQNYKHEFAFSGVHILRNDFFEHFTETGSFSIMKTYMRLMQDQYIQGYNHTGSILIDVGKVSSIAEAEKWFQ